MVGIGCLPWPFWQKMPGDVWGQDNGEEATVSGASSTSCSGRCTGTKSWPLAQQAVGRNKNCWKGILYFIYTPMVLPVYLYYSGISINVIL